MFATQKLAGPREGVSIAGFVKAVEYINNGEFTDADLAIGGRVEKESYDPYGATCRLRFGSVEMLARGSRFRLSRSNKSRGPKVPEICLSFQPSALRAHKYA